MLWKIQIHTEILKLCNLPPSSDIVESKKCQLRDRLWVVQPQLVASLVKSLWYL